MTIRAGQPVSASWANRVEERATRENVGPLSTQTPQGTIQRPAVPPVGGGTFGLFRLIDYSGFGDYWTGYLFAADGLTLVQPQTVIPIAKPRRLQYSYWNGKTFEGKVYTGAGYIQRSVRRIADNVTQTEVIVPGFRVITGSEDYILAVKIKTGIQTVPPNAVDIEWADLNWEGRAFAEAYF